MSTIAPPPPPPPMPPPSGAPAQPTATVAVPPETLAKLTQGATLDVTVLVSRAKGQQVEVDSAFGKFSMRATMPLTEGAKLAMQVAAIGQQVKFRITALNGQPLLATLGTATPGAPAPPGQGPIQGLATTGTLHRGDAAAVTTAPRSAAPAGGPVLTRADGLAATVLRGPSGPASIAPPGQVAGSVAGQPTLGATGLVTGTQLTVRLAAIQTPTPTPTAAPAAAPAIASPATPGVIPAPSPVGPQIAHPIAGQPVAAAAPHTLPPGVYAQTAEALPPPIGGGYTGPKPIMTLTGTVAANTHGNQTVINTPQGMIALNTRLDVPAGTTLTLEVMTRTAPPPMGGPAAAAAMTTAGPPLTGGQGWPALSEALDYLQQTAPDLAKQLRAAIPQADGRLAATAIAFTGALRAVPGSRPWPSDSLLRELERTGPRGEKLAQALGADMAELAGQAREPRGDWRAMTLPFLNGAEIDRITLYVHRDPEENNPEEARPKSAGERFLIDLDLSAMGPMQLDGYVVTKERRFDLIIRTETAVEGEHRRAILGIFADAVDALGLTGTLNFLVTRQFVRPERAAESLSGPGVMV